MSEVVWQVWKEAEDEWDNEIEVLVGEYDNAHDAELKARDIRGRGYEAWVEREEEDNAAHG